jgi:hypothetical protein
MEKAYLIIDDMVGVLTLDDLSFFILEMVCFSMSSSLEWSNFTRNSGVISLIFPAW